MYSNIRNEVKPTALKGPQKRIIPRHQEQLEYPMDFQHVLATTNPEDIIWDTLLDKRPSNVTYFDTTGTRSELLQHHHAEKEPYTKDSLSTVYPKTQQHYWQAKHHHNGMDMMTYSENF